MAKNIEESFKREVAHFAITSGLARRQVAADFGVSLSSVNRWVDQFGDGSVLAAETADLATENKRLRKELQIAQAERDILKKATAFFASQK